MNHHNCPLRERAIQQPYDKALICVEGELSFADVDSLVECCRQAIRSQGIMHGNRLGLVSHNTPSMVVLLLACWREGVIACPLNPRFTDQRLEALSKQLHLHACWFEEPERGNPLPVNSFYWSLVKTALHPDASLLSLEMPPEISSLLLTSGSSGNAKAVALTTDNFISGARCSIPVLDLGKDDGWLLSLPLFHVGGISIIFRCLLAGAAIVLADRSQSIAEVIQKQPVTHLSLVNTQLYRLLESDLVWSETKARVLLLGGSSVTPSLIERCAHSGLKVLTSFGMTESAALVCCGSPVLVENTLTSGAVIPGREVILADNGEILLRGQGVFSGYWQNGVLDTARDKQGWFHSRDKGRWVDGQLLIEGRMDNMMISGGENIQPEAIERILLTHPAVAEALVVPVPDDEYGQRPVAYIYRNDDKLQAESLIELLTITLARFKVPDYFILWSESLAAEGLKVNREHYQQRAGSCLNAKEDITYVDGFVRLST